MAKVRIKRDEGPDLSFDGKVMSHISSDDGSKPQWAELLLYKTPGGIFVCQELGRSRVAGQRDFCRAEVCKTESEVIEFFGHGWLAKQVYEEAGIDAAVEIK